MKKIVLCLLAISALLSVLATDIGCATKGAAEPLTPQERLRVATTTSLYDTGLWGYLEPMFEETYDVEVDVLYTGSGIAFEYGKRGDVDVITIHDKPKELQFIADGYGVERVPFAYNYFLIVGPESDPAGIKGMTPGDAFKRLAEMGSASFISRGDDSGTHSKEKAIWQSAGFDYEAIRTSGAWYVETGKGMGPTLLHANEKQGYTLVDMGTFVAYKGKVNLVPLVDKGSILLNVYSVIAVNPEKVTGVKLNSEMAANMVGFLTSPEIQKLIGEYGVQKYGLQLFTPCAGAEPQP